MALDFPYLYYPHYNTGTPFFIGVLPINIFIYLLIILSAFSLLLYSQVFKKNKCFFRLAALRAAAVVFVLLQVWQVINQGTYFNYVLRAFGGKPMEQEYALLFSKSDVRAFADFCLREKAAYGQAAFVSDLDSYWALEQWVLTYFLYPDINTLPSPGSKFTTIVYAKIRGREHVPPHYRILAEFSDDKMIAVKEGKAP